MRKMPPACIYVGRWPGEAKPRKTGSNGERNRKGPRARTARSRTKIWGWTFGRVGVGGGAPKGPNCPSIQPSRRFPSRFFFLGASRRNKNQESPAAAAAAGTAAAGRGTCRSLRIAELGAKSGPVGMGSNVSGLVPWVPRSFPGTCLPAAATGTATYQVLMLPLYRYMGMQFRIISGGGYM